MGDRKFQINALTLHLFAMFCMLLDHMWATVISGNMWMTWVGRIAFPIFAFMAVEGYFHTSNFRKYMKRLLVAALISEIPFNLMTGGGLLNPFHQNVLWTFLLSLLCVSGLERVRKRDMSTGKKAFFCSAISLAGVAAGAITMVDYYAAGVLTVLVFYFFRGRHWYQMVGQAVGIYLINFRVLKNMSIPLTLFGCEFLFPTQGFAILALLPIWLYRGRQGPHNKAIQYFCYAFYPVHILILALIARWR